MDQAFGHHRAVPPVRGECKMPDGKLVAVTVSLSDHIDPSLGLHLLAACTIDGDFFLDGPEGGAGLLDELQHCLVSQEVPVAIQDLESRLQAVVRAASDQTLFGASPHTLAVAFARALSQASWAYLDPSTRELLESSASLPLRRSVGAQLNPVDLDSAQFASWLKRWQELDLGLVVDQARPPAMQLALDWVLAQAVREKRLGPLIRFWSWDRPAVVIGRFQSLSQQVDLAKAHELDLSVVRRATGGGAMFVQPDKVITYSLYLPDSFVKGLDLASSYKLCDLWILLALRGLGIEAGWQGSNDIASERGKIGGSAQRHFPAQSALTGALLHHVMLAYDIDTATMGQVVKVSHEKMRDKAVSSARARVDPLCRHTNLSRDQLLAAVIDSLETLCPDTHEISMEAGLLQDAEGLSQNRYSQPSWTAAII